MDIEKIADRAAVILAGMAMRGIPPNDPEAIKEALQAARALTIAAELPDHAPHGMVRQAMIRPDPYAEFAAAGYPVKDDLDPEAVRRVGFNPVLGQGYQGDERNMPRPLAKPNVSTKHNAGKS